MQRVRVDERDLLPGEALPGRLVDERRALRGEMLECVRDVVHLERDVVHRRAAPGEEAADRRVLCERGD